MHCVLLTQTAFFANEGGELVREVREVLEPFPSKLVRGAEDSWTHPDQDYSAIRPPEPRHVD